MDLSGWTIAFDLDGTLVETAPDLVATLNAVLASEGLAPVPYDEARNMVGHGAKRLIEKGYAATGLPLSPELSPVLFDRFIDHYLAHIADTSRPFAGCIAALEALKDAGATLVVATNKRTDLSLALLDALGMTDHFAAVIGADLAPAPKPDGRHILFAIEEADGDPDQAIMVGDSISDIDGAKNAGVPVIGVTFGYTDTPVGELGCDAVIAGYGELLAAIGKLAKA
ncbi:MAG: HAD family hydrolase [Caulobacteraceae bacterium]|nr:MAG: HAD family hydrolase [Caulobacteraceae bacterium]